jgi:hypothetical protein
MIRLSKVLIVSVAIASVQYTSFAQEVCEEKATTDVSTKLDLILTRLQSIDERLRRIESKFNSTEHRSGIQNSDLPIECDFLPSPGVVPGQKVVPGQILGRIVPRRRVQMISPWLEPRAVIETLDAFDRNFKRK